jgi:hypothetical protein
MPRQEHPFVTRYFTRLQQENNTSRFFYCCKLCPQPDGPDEPNFILHRDNRLFRHVKDQCSKATAQMKQEANKCILERGKVKAEDRPFWNGTPAGTKAGTLEDADVEPEDNHAQSSKKRKVRPKQVPIGTFLDREMTEPERSRVDMSYVR